MSELLSLTIESASHGTTVRVAGEIDLASAPTLQACLAVQHGEVVVVDLAEVSFLDSTALAVLVSEHKRRVAAGERLVIRGSSPITLRVFEATGLDHLLDLNGDSFTIPQDRPSNGQHADAG